MCNKRWRAPPGQVTYEGGLSSHDDGRARRRHMINYSKKQGSDEISSTKQITHNETNHYVTFIKELRNFTDHWHQQNK